MHKGVRSQPTRHFLLMPSPMESMLAEREARMRQNEDATASLVKHQQDHKHEVPVPHLSRNGWRQVRPRRWHGPSSRRQVIANRLAWFPNRRPVFEGRPTQLQVLQARAAWRAETPRPLDGPPDRSRLLTVRTAWTDFRPPVRIGPVSAGRVPIVRLLWIPNRPEPSPGEPDFSRVEQVRTAWDMFLARPSRVGAFQGSPGDTGPFWSWLWYIGSQSHIIRDYVKHWHQHIDMDLNEIQMVTHEAAVYFSALTARPNDNWVPVSAAPCSLYNNGSVHLGSIPSDPDRMDAASNAVWGIDSHGKPYWSDTGVVPARDRAKLKYNGTIVWLEQ